ncbi:ankyrin repeat domain-containing protein [Jeotgalibacillus sp. ET6]|uniref:ankyrin repeat domain-containing protein n=1 Tax=Jeotgalibacillus sp. ET6 TaxID=3037260 RepID=UPI00241876A4|nr:ankyrin repeat domain-containing protein [Jeotgalibacillus sp. ET6]MDG5470968.1 ankyrin repeat domain-containing protein [Jeotgalibacillus sp. ET6]
MKKKILITLAALFVVLAAASGIRYMQVQNFKGESEPSVFFESIYDKDKEKVKALLDSGMSPNAKNEMDQTALEVSIEINAVEIARMLLNEGADVEPHFSRTALQAMVDPALGEENSLNDSMFELLKDMAQEEPEIVLFQAENGENLLFEAIRNQHKPTILWLLEKGVDPHAINDHGETTFHAAVKYPADQTGFYFESAQYTRGTANADMETPLSLAVKSGQPGWVLLLKNVEDINKPNSMGWTPIMFAVDFGFESIVEELIDSGADLSIVNQDGDTAATLARKWENETIIELVEK